MSSTVKPRRWAELPEPTPDQFRAELERFGLTQQQAAKFFDVDERNVRRWATGDAPVPLSVEMVFRLMREHGLTVDDVDALMAREG